MLNCHIDNFGIEVDVLQSLVHLPRMIGFSFQAPLHLFNNSLRLFLRSFIPLDLLRFLWRQPLFEQICRTLADLEWAEVGRAMAGCPVVADLVGEVAGAALVGLPAVELANV